jgi:hypothetical protein
LKAQAFEAIAQQTASLDPVPERLAAMGKDMQITHNPPFLIIAVKIGGNHALTSRIYNILIGCPDKMVNFWILNIAVHTKATQTKNPLIGKTPVIAQLRQGC